MPGDIETSSILSAGPKASSANEYVNKMVKRIQVINEVARKTTLENQEKAKAAHDVRPRSFSYLPGEKVWLFQPKIPVGVSRKLIKQFEGPYFIIQQTSPSNYIIAHCETKKQIGYAVNVERLKPYYDIRDMSLNYPHLLPDRHVTVGEPEVVGENMESDPDVMTSGDANQLPEVSDQIATPDTQVDISLPPTTQTGNQIMNTDQVQADKQMSTPKVTKWYRVINLIGVKLTGSKRYYKVVYANTKYKPEWIEESNVTDALKIEFHVKHTLNGKLRREFRRNKK